MESAISFAPLEILLNEPWMLTDFHFLLLLTRRSDFMIEEEIQHLLKYKTQWWNELRAIQKAEKGKGSLQKQEEKSYNRSGGYNL